MLNLRLKKAMCKEIVKKYFFPGKFAWSVFEEGTMNFSNWRPNEPNDHGEPCTLIGTKKAAI